jgi:signal transduction histidine kinase
MHVVIKWLESLYGAIPLNLLEVWGGFGYLLGFVLMLAAYGGLTLRPHGRWGLGMMRQSWDNKALLSAVITFGAIFVTGYIGSFIVLVPGAQTFESLKDLSVFLCVVLFGYPALLAVPLAYGLSDLVEGVPPAFLLDWGFGYFINPACFWIAHQLIGRRPDFRRGRTWGWYLVFVLLFMLVEPQLWGHITAPQFTPAIAYRTLVPALFFTTAITWLIAPLAMLGALPLARRFGMFWAEMPLHVKERRLGAQRWRWVNAGGGAIGIDSGSRRIPIRVVMAAPFIILLLLTVGSTAYVTLSSAENASVKLASRLHEEIAENINLQLDDYLAQSQVREEDADMLPPAVGQLLHKLPMAQHGRAIVIDLQGKLIASSEQLPLAADAVALTAVTELRKAIPALAAVKVPQQLHFDVITSKPLARESWLMQVTPYQDRSGHTDWLLLTAMPESWYLEGVRTGNSQSAMVFAVALMLTVVGAIVLSSLVTAPVSRLARATRALARGELHQRVPGSRLDELGALSASFNFMAERLQRSFDELSAMTATLAAREKALEQSERQLRSHRDHLEQAVHERTAALSVALTHAEAANRAKSVFLSNMSHELRTPLNAVIGFSDMLGGEAQLEQEQRRKLGLIHRSGLHLLTLINDILELSRIETGQLSLQLAPVDLRLLFDMVLDAVRLQADPARVALQLDCAGAPAVVMADGAKLRQVLWNLLSNGVKFVGSGQVRLSVQPVPAASAGAGAGFTAGDIVRLRFAVSDTGPGIAAPDREHIFQPFVQADTPATQAGTGLGLTISREFVRLMGGELELDSTVGAGSTFWFTLDLEVCEAPPAATMESASGAAFIAAPEEAERTGERADAGPGSGAGTAPADTLAAALRQLSAGQRDALKQAVAILDLASVADLIAEIEQRQPVLAARLRRMASAAQYPQLWELLDRA